MTKKAKNMMLQQSNQKETQVYAIISQKKQKQKRLRWTSIERLSYLKFVNLNKQTLEMAHKIDKQKVFSRMADFITAQSKSSNQIISHGRKNKQCKSHHQKMLNKYGSIQEFLKAEKLIYGLTEKQLMSNKQKNKQIFVKIVENNVAGLQICETRGFFEQQMIEIESFFYSQTSGQNFLDEFLMPI